MLTLVSLLYLGVVQAQALLSAPNPDDPLANDVAEMWKSNEAQALQTGIIQ